MTTLLASGVAALIIDQHSKNLVRLYSSDRALPAGSVVRFRYVRHVHDSYERPHIRVLFVLSWAAAFIASILLQRTGEWFQSPAASIGLGFALGGAAGNLIDILRLRHVVDFVDLRWWPLFNVADLAITAGLPLAFLA